MPDPEPQDEFYKEVNENQEMIDNAAQMVEAVRIDIPEGEGKAAELVELVTLLQTLGVQPLQAAKYAQSIARDKCPTFMELYGQGRPVEARNGCHRKL